MSAASVERETPVMVSGQTLRYFGVVCTHFCVAFETTRQAGQKYKAQGSARECDKLKSNLPACNC